MTSNMIHSNYNGRKRPSNSNKASRSSQVIGSAGSINYNTFLNNDFNGLLVSACMKDTDIGPQHLDYIQNILPNCNPEIPGFKVIPSEYRFKELMEETNVHEVDLKSKTEITAMKAILDYNKGIKDSNKLLSSLFAAINKCATVLCCDTINDLHINGKENKFLPHLWYTEIQKIVLSNNDQNVKSKNIYSLFSLSQGKDNIELAMHKVSKVLSSVLSNDNAVHDDLFRAILLGNGENDISYQFVNDNMLTTVNDCLNRNMNLAECKLALLASDTLKQSNQQSFSVKVNNVQRSDLCSKCNRSHPGKPCFVELAKSDPDAVPEWWYTKHKDLDKRNIPTVIKGEGKKKQAKAKSVVQASDSDSDQEGVMDAYARSIVAAHGSMKKSVKIKMISSSTPTTESVPNIEVSPTNEKLTALVTHPDGEAVKFTLDSAQEHFTYETSILSAGMSVQANDEITELMNNEDSDHEYPILKIILS